MSDPTNATPAEIAANEEAMKFINAQRALMDEKAFLQQELNSLESDVRKRLNALEGSPRFVKDNAELSKFIRDNLKFFYLEQENREENRVWVLRKMPGLKFEQQGGARNTRNRKARKSRKQRKQRKSRRTRRN
jgi:hypothetical protein